MPDLVERKPRVYGSTREFIFMAAGRIQPGMLSYKSAQRVLDFIQRVQEGQPFEVSVTPELTRDIFNVLHAAGIKTLIVPISFIKKSNSRS